MKRSSVRLHLEQLEDRIVPSSPGDIDWLRQFGSGFGGSDQGLDPARAVAADGSVRTLSPSVSGNTWWAAVAPSGGEVPGSDW